MAADVCAEAVLAMQVEELAGVPAPALEQGPNFQYAVHQAAGMVSAQIDVTIARHLTTRQAGQMVLGALLVLAATDRRRRAGATG